MRRRKSEEDDHDNDEHNDDNIASYSDGDVAADQPQSRSMRSLELLPPLDPQPKRGVTSP